MTLLHLQPILSKAKTVLFIGNPQCEKYSQSFMEKTTFHKKITCFSFGGANNFPESIVDRKYDLVVIDESQFGCCMNFNTKYIFVQGVSLRQCNILSSVCKIPGGWNISSNGRLTDKTVLMTYKTDTSTKPEGL
jgi:hypothetical protein